MVIEKVVLIVSCLKGGGAERSVLTLGEGFYQLGYEVHIVRFKDTVEYTLNNNLYYHHVSLKPPKVIRSHQIRYKFFAKILDRYITKNIGYPKIILSNLDKVHRVMRYSRLPNIYHVLRNTLSKEMELAGDDKEMTHTYLKNLFKMHPCIAISKGVEQDFNTTLGLTNTTTIYNPIDRQLIQGLSEQDILTPDFRDYILHVGSFKAQKAHDILIKAYAKTNKSIPLVLLGKGALMQEMQALVASLEIEDKVIFAGFHKNPYPYIKQAKAMVLSSNFEGFGRVIAEAMALDTPVISTDCPSGPSELLPVKNLVPVADIDTLADKMNNAMQDATPYHVPFDESLLPINIAKQYIEFMLASASIHSPSKR